MNRICDVKTTLVQLLAIFFLGGHMPAHADDSYSGYDSIVRELSSTQTDAQGLTPNRDPFEVIKFHAGVSMVTSQLSLDLPGRLPHSKSMHGYEAQFGIDLFSPRWVAMASVRTFDPEGSRTTEVHLREFDLIILYKTKLNTSSVEFALGGGMTSRYLDLTGDIPAGAQRSYTTPSTVISSGLSYFLTPAVSLGVNFSLRNPLIKDTIDDGSADGAFQVAGHF